MYIHYVESRLKNNGATHEPEREFHEGSDGFIPFRPPRVSQFPFKTGFFIFCLITSYKETL